MFAPKNTCSCKSQIVVLTKIKAHSRQIIWQCVAKGIATQELENPGGNVYLLVYCLPQVALAVKANRRDEDTQVSKRKQIMCKI